MTKAVYAQQKTIRNNWSGWFWHYYVLTKIKTNEFPSVLSLISEYSQGYLLPEFTKIKNRLPDTTLFSEEIFCRTRANTALSELRKKY